MEEDRAIAVINFTHINASFHVAKAVYAKLTSVCFIALYPTDIRSNFLTQLKKNVTLPNFILFYLMLRILTHRYHTNNLLARQRVAGHIKSHPQVFPKMPKTKKISTFILSAYLIHHLVLLSGAASTRYWRRRWGWCENQAKTVHTKSSIRASLLCNV